MASTPDFKYAPMFQMGEDTTEYRLLTKEGVSTGEFEGKTILKVSKEALTLLAQQAFHDVEFMLRREHNLQVAKILSDPEASENDKYVALQFLRNAETAAKGVLPFCQDTGTAIIHGEKGQRVWTDFEDEEALSLGVYNTFTQDNLRYSQNAPLNMYDEVNTRCNLPAQIDIEAVEGDEYRFIMVAKGGSRLLAADAVDALKERLLPLATIITPNLPEAMCLLGREEDVTEEEFPEVARELWKLLGRRNAWVYLKGGHLEGESAYDLLFNNVVSVPFTAPRVPTKNTHGTGCTLSSAIAAFLPQSVDVPEACRRAKEYLTGAVRHAGERDVGHGHGPTNHFWRLWKERV